VNSSRNLPTWERILNRKLGERAQARRALDSAGAKFEVAEDRLADAKIAQEIIQTVAQATQKQLEYKISELASLALSSVFDDPYELVLRFEEHRGKTAARLLFARSGHEVDPMACAGGGPVDAAALALQISLWTLRAPRTRSLLVLDEPLKFLKGGDMPERGAAIIKELATRLGVQILMVSHDPSLVATADKVFDMSSKEKLECSPVSRRRRKPRRSREK